VRRESRARRAEPGWCNSASLSEVGGYKRAMREQQAQKSCDEIENKNRHFVTDTVILAWQTMTPRAVVPPAPPASQ
jgi:hypothetical protein